MNIRMKREMFFGLEEYCKIVNVTVIKGKINDVALTVLLRMRFSLHYFIPVKIVHHH